jgi:hypothetical protein
MRTLSFAVAVAAMTAIAHAEEPWWNESTVSGVHDRTALIWSLPVNFEETCGAVVKKPAPWISWEHYRWCFVELEHRTTTTRLSRIRHVWGIFGDDPRDPGESDGD